MKKHFHDHSPPVGAYAWPQLDHDVGERDSLVVLVDRSAGEPNHHACSSIAAGASSFPGLIRTGAGPTSSMDTAVGSPARPAAHRVTTRGRTTVYTSRVSRRGRFGGDVSILRPDARYRTERRTSAT